MEKSVIKNKFNFEEIKIIIGNFFIQNIQIKAHESGCLLALLIN